MARQGAAYHRSVLHYINLQPHMYIEQYVGKMKLQEKMSCSSLICLINMTLPLPKPTTKSPNPLKPISQNSGVGYHQEEPPLQYFLSPWLSSKNSIKHSGFLPCLGNFPELLSSTDNFQSYLGCIPLCYSSVSSPLTFALTTKAIAVRDSFTKMLLQCCHYKH